MMTFIIKNIKNTIWTIILQIPFISKKNQHYQIHHQDDLKKKFFGNSTKSEA